MAAKSKPTATRCRVCGSQNDTSVSFCGTCGSTIAVRTPTPGKLRQTPEAQISAVRPTSPKAAPMEPVLSADSDQPAVADVPVAGTPSDTPLENVTVLYTELTAAEVDALKLRSAAMDVEAAISTRSRGPLSVAPLPLVDANLRTCMYYLLEIVTRLPIRMTTQRQASFLAGQLGGHHPRLLLAELAWEIRRRLFRSAKAIRLFDANAFGANPYPQIPARQDAPAAASDGVAGGEFGPVGEGAQGDTHGAPDLSQAFRRSRS